MAAYLPADNDIGVGYAPVLDISVNGQEGLNEQLQVWDASAAYLKQNLQAFLVSPPRLMKYMPGYELRLQFLKSLIETRARSITGLASTINLEYVSKDVGSAGNQKHSVAGGKIDVSTPSFTWPEYANATVVRFIEDLIRFVYYDPDLGGPGVRYSKAWLDDENALPISDVNQEMYVGYVEPNAEFTKPVRAWLCAQQPQSTGEIIGQMTKGAALESPDVNIVFNATTHRYDTARLLAQEHLDKIMSEDFTSETGLGFTAAQAIHSDVNAQSAVGAATTLNSGS